MGIFKCCNCKKKIDYIKLDESTTNLLDEESEVNTETNVEIELEDNFYPTNQEDKSNYLQWLLSNSGAKDFFWQHANTYSVELQQLVGSLQMNFIPRFPEVYDFLKVKGVVDDQYINEYTNSKKNERTSKRLSILTDKIQAFKKIRGPLEKKNFKDLIFSILRLIFVYTPIIISNLGNVVLIILLISQCYASLIDGKSNLIYHVDHNVSCLKSHLVSDNDLFKHVTIDYDNYFFDCHKKYLIPQINKASSVEFFDEINQHFYSKAAFMETVNYRDDFNFKKCVCEGNLQICNFECNLGADNQDPVKAGIVYDSYSADVYYVHDIYHDHDEGCVGGSDGPEHLRDNCRNHPICTYIYYDHDEKRCNTGCGVDVPLFGHVGTKVKVANTWAVTATRYENMKIFNSHREVSIAGVDVNLPENATVSISETAESCNNGFIIVNGLMYCRTSNGDLPSPWFINHNRLTGVALADAILNKFGIVKQESCGSGHNYPYQELGITYNGMCNVNLVFQNTNNDLRLKNMCILDQFKKCDVIKYIYINESAIWIESEVCRFMGKLMSNGVNDLSAWKYYLNQDCTIRETTGNGLNKSCTNIIYGNFSEIYLNNGTGIDIDIFDVPDWTSDLDIFSKIKHYLPIILITIGLIILIIISILIIIYLINPIALFKYLIQSRIKRRIDEFDKSHYEEIPSKPIQTPNSLDELQ